MNRIFIIEFLAITLIMVACVQDPAKPEHECSEPEPAEQPKEKPGDNLFEQFEQLFRYQG